MRFLNIDTVYSGVQDKYSHLIQDEMLRKCHGTADYLTHELNRLGYVADNYVISWRDKYNGLYDAINKFGPDVVFVQNLSSVPVSDVTTWRARGIKVVGFCSYKFTNEDVWSEYDVVLTSFPHYAERPGWKFVPLATSDLPFYRLGYGDDVDVYDEERIYDVVFVGGMRRNTWERGQTVVQTLDKRYRDRLHCWGYGDPDCFPEQYVGELWGLDYWKVLCQSKVVVNRHGEIAGNYSNNMRMFEATAAGAMLVTEASDNLSDYFDPQNVVTYTGERDLVDGIDYALEYDDYRNRSRRETQKTTWSNHLYKQRIHKILEAIE